MLIQACLNGSTTRAEHPAVPLTPAELAAEARASAAAGAESVHLHPRDPSGAQTLIPDHVLAAVAAVRAASGLPVGVTTGIWTVDGDTARRMSLVDRWTGQHRPDFASINVNEPGTDALADLLTSLGIEIEAGVWTAGGRAAARRELVRRPGDPGAARTGRPVTGRGRRDGRGGVGGTDQARDRARHSCTTVTAWPPGM